MLPPKNRLVKREDFNKAWKEGEIFSSKNFIVKVAPNKIKKTRVGFSASKNLFKKAVLRNRAKRFLRGVVKAYLGLIRPGFDVIIFCRNRGCIFQKNGSARLKNELKDTFEKAKLL